MDKLRAISIFRRIVELGSFKAAADDLGMSKAAISKNINELEEYLNNPLINRTTRHLHVTESGQYYYRKICGVLDDLAYADLSIMESSYNLKGRMKISIPMSMGLVEINPVVCQFMILYPDISIEVVMSDQYVDLLEQGIDVAIRGSSRLRDSSLKSRKILDMRRLLCASSKYIEQSGLITEPKDLMHANCLIYSLSAAPRRWLFRCQDETEEIELSASSYVANNGLALKQAGLSGIGVILLPELFVNEELRSGDLIELLPEWSVDKLSLYALYPYHKEESQKVRTFIDFIVEKLGGKYQ